MKRKSRADLRGKPLDDICKLANILKYKYGSNDEKCFCYGLFMPGGANEIHAKCIKCGAYFANAKPLNKTL